MAKIYGTLAYLSRIEFLHIMRILYTFTVANLGAILQLSMASE